MIIEGLFNLLGGIVSIVFTIIRIPASIAIPDGIFSGLSTITYGIGYILPVSRLMPIFTISIVILTVKIGIAVVLRIKSFIPSMGGGS